MTITDALELSIRSCLISFFAGAFWVSFVLILGSAFLLQESFNPLTFFIAPVFALVTGLVPVLVFGIPTYAALLYKGWANWATVIVLGLLPAAFLWPIQDGAFSLFFALYGPPIALFAHFLGLRKMRSNNSFKPNPHQGGA